MKSEKQIPYGNDRKKSKNKSKDLVCYPTPASKLAGDPGRKR